MSKRLCGTALLIMLWGCAPPDSITGTPAPQPTQTVVVAPPQTATPIAALTPTASPTAVLAEPDFPPGVLRSMDRVAGLTPAMKETEVWWANSGIQNNRLGYYASPKSPKEVEEQLLPSFLKHRPYHEGIGPVFDFDGCRVCLMKRPESELEELFVLVPLGDPPVIPDTLKALKLPKISLEALKGQKTLVVLATGQGLGEHVDHMLGQAGLVLTPTPSVQPESTPH